MLISYKKLWKLLIDKDLKKQDLRRVAQLNSSTVAKLTHGENALQGDMADIIEVIPDRSPASDK